MIFGKACTIKIVKIPYAANCIKPIWPFTTVKFGKIEVNGVHTHNGILRSRKKEGAWMERENIILSAVS